MKRIFIYILLLGVSLWSCIPIEDRFNPNSSEFDVLDIFHVQDTFKFDIIFTDNAELDKAFIRITQETGVFPATWQVTDSVILAGRRFEYLYDTFIPLQANEGRYKIEILILDVGGNSKTITDLFEVQGDVRSPVFSIEVDILNMEKDAEERYVACRLQVPDLDGYVVDNIELAKIEAQIEGFPKVTRVLTSGIDSVSLRGFFGSDLRVPDNVEDREELNLTITATDIDGNVSSRTLKLIVDCDDQIPTIEVLQTIPEINSTNKISVIRGEEFIVTSAKIRDNRFVKDFFVLFGERDAAKDTVLTQAIDIADSIAIEDVLGEVAVLIPEEALVGSKYDFVLLATDTSQNVSEPFLIEISVAQDEAPRIIVSNTLIDNLDTLLTKGVTGQNPIKAGQEFRIEGKVEDDLGLSYYRIFWGIEGREARVVDLDNTELSLPFNFADTRSINEFIVPQDARVGDIYKLSIKVKDLRNEEIETVFRFVIE
jgi:hypothetical protein